MQHTFKHYLSNNSKIIFQSNGKRLVFPLHPGLFKIKDRHNFEFNYDTSYIDKYNKNFPKLYEKGVTCSYSTQIYKLFENSTTSVTIPHIYNKTFQTNSTIVKVDWDARADFINNIKLITYKPNNEYIVDNDIFVL